MFVRASLYMRREENPLDASEWFIALFNLQISAINHSVASSGFSSLRKLFRDFLHKFLFWMLIEFIWTNL